MTFGLRIGGRLVAWVVSRPRATRPPIAARTRRFAHPGRVRHTGVHGPRLESTGVDKTARPRWQHQLAPLRGEPAWPPAARPFFFFTTLKTTQRQIDGFFSQLPFKCYLPEVASVGD